VFTGGICPRSFKDGFEIGLLKQVVGIIKIGCLLR